MINQWEFRFSRYRIDCAVRFESGRDKEVNAMGVHRHCRKLACESGGVAALLRRRLTPV